MLAKKPRLYSITKLHRLINGELIEPYIDKLSCKLFCTSALIKNVVYLHDKISLIRKWKYLSLVLHETVFLLMSQLL